MPSGVYRGRVGVISYNPLPNCLFKCNIIIHNIIYTNPNKNCKNLVTSSLLHNLGYATPYNMYIPIPHCPLPVGYKL